MGCASTTSPEYADHVAALRAEHPELAAVFADFGGVADVLAWMKRAGLAQTAVDIVGMDEFEYDFLIRLRPDGEWVAFGLT
jgi:hypothetical protein